MRIKYQRALVILAVVVFFTDLAVYLSLPEVASLNPWYWIVALGAAAAPLFLTRESMIALRRSPILYWCYGYLMITAVWLLCEGVPSDNAWQEFRTRVLSIFFIAVALCLTSSEDAQLWARRAIVVGVLMAVGLNVYELFHPQAFSLVVGRSAGFYVNPTKSGSALLLGMIFSVGVLPQRFRLLFAMLVLMGMLLTLSRGPLLCWPIVMFMMIKTGQISLKRSLAIGGLVFTVLVIIVLSQWQAIQYQLEDIGVLNSDVAQRIEGFINFDEFGVDLSAAKRKEVASEALEAFADRPIWGYGIAATKDLGFEMGLHNLYLRLMLDHGVIGSFILPLFVLASVWGARGEARSVGLTFAAFILCWGFFSHNVLEEYYILMAFALLAAMSVSSWVHNRQHVEAQHRQVDFPALRRPEIESARSF